MSVALASKNLITEFTSEAIKGYLPASTEIEILKNNYWQLIASTGEDTERDGLQKTPERAAKAWKALTSGYDTDPAAILRSAVFEEDYNDMVMVHDIEFYSLCEHHLLPFFGKAHIAYIPTGKIVGLSKLPRMVDAFARRLQVQERLTKQIADLMEETLDPAGVAVLIEASHMCMMMRGVEKQHSATTTSALRGVFTTDQGMRETFLRRTGQR